MLISLKVSLGSRRARRSASLLARTTVYGYAGLPRHGHSRRRLARRE